jgi:hypothetical protein
MPLVEAICSHVFAAKRIHADDTTVPVLAKGKTRTGRLWTYVRDDRPFGGPDPPAAMFFYSQDRGGEHIERRGRLLGTCRRNDLATLAKAPIAIEADVGPGDEPKRGQGVSPKVHLWDRMGAPAQGSPQARLRRRDPPGV